MNSVNLVEDSTRRLDLPRGGLRVTQEDAEDYERLVSTIDSLAAGPVILALPGIPEVYFLAHRRNPTGVLFEVYEDPRERIASVRRALASEQVGLAVINNRLGFSGELNPGLRAPGRQRVSGGAAGRPVHGAPERGGCGIRSAVAVGVRPMASRNAS